MRSSSTRRRPSKQASEEAERAEETLREKRAELDNAEAEKRRLEKEMAHAERRKQ
jgi:hypothetical protein